jgi:phosphoglycolate phosphatase-like HAD superfamily hydrolase
VTPLAQLLAERRQVLIDFDGPICSVFGSVTDRQVANALREVVAGYTRQISEPVASAHDPFEVLRFAASIDLECLARTEEAFVACEIDAVSTAPETPGMRAALDALVSSGLSVTIVSNNSAAAITSFANHRGLTSKIAGIVGRAPAQPALLKPNPYLLAQAINERKTVPRDTLFIGDSISDIEAGAALDIPVVAYANRPGKRERFAAMHPAAVINSMWTLSGA